MSDDGAQHSIGRLINEGEQRDAIHVAVLPVRAGHLVMARGDFVMLNRERKAVPARDRADAIGIVDPYLGFEDGRNYVLPGEWFWLCILPRKTTSLRHAWTHPEIDDEPGVIQASREPIVFDLVKDREWLAKWWEEQDAPGSLDEFLIAATEGFEVIRPDDGWGGVSLSVDEDGVHSSGVDASGSIPDEVWDRVERLTGKKVVARPTYFTCSC